MLTTAEHAAIIRTRADRIATVIRDNRDLLNGCGIPANPAIVRVRRDALDAVNNGAHAYEALRGVDGLIRRLRTVGDRLTGTYTDRDGGIVTVSGDSPRQRDGDNLIRISHRIALDILGDRDDDPLFDVR